MTTPKYPGDLLMNFCDRPDINYVYKLKFAAWGTAYDKGANAGVVIETKTSLSNGIKVKDEYFPNDESCTISIKKIQSGMKYADLIELSKWASETAKWVKYMETKGKYGNSFDATEKEVCSIIPDKE
jgi:hypothetical protein